MNLADAPEYLTVKQLADILQVPVATVYRWRHLGEGPRGIRVSGRHVRFRRCDVEVFLREHEDPAPTGLARSRCLMASIERRPDRPKQWRAKYRTPDGRVHSRSFARKVDAERFLAIVETDRSRGTWVDPIRARQTLEAWTKQWRASKVDLRPSTLARLDSTLRAQVLPEFGPRRLDTIGNAEVRAWIARMTAEGRSATTIRKAYFALNDLLAAAVADRRLTFNPAQDVRLPAERYEEQRFLAPDDIARLLEAVSADRYRALVRVAVYGGLRFGELAALRRGSVNPLRGRVSVTETLVDVAGHLSLGPPKTRNSRRTVPLPRSIVTGLEEHLVEFVAPEDDAFVFTGPEGGPLRRSLFRSRVWLPAVSAASLEGLRFHDLRHTFVALWIAAGANPKEVSVRASHSSVAFTLDRYGHLYENADDAVAEQLDALLKPRPASEGGTG